MTLDFSGTPDLFALARSFGAVIVNHNVGDPQYVIDHQDLLGPDVELIHCTRWTDEAWRIAAATGIHVSIATLIEMQMRHDIPPI